MEDNQNKAYQDCAAFGYLNQTILNKLPWCPRFLNLTLSIYKKFTQTKSDHLCEPVCSLLRQEAIGLAEKLVLDQEPFDQVNPLLSIVIFQAALLLLGALWLSYHKYCLSSKDSLSSRSSSPPPTPPPITPAAAAQPASSNTAIVRITAPPSLFLPPSPAEVLPPSRRQILEEARAGQDPGYEICHPPTPCCIQATLQRSTHTPLHRPPPTVRPTARSHRRIRLDKNAPPPYSEKSQTRSSSHHPLESRRRESSEPPRNSRRHH